MAEVQRWDWERDAMLESLLGNWSPDGIIYSGKLPLTNKSLLGFLIVYCTSQVAWLMNRRGDLLIGGILLSWVTQNNFGHGAINMFRLVQWFPNFFETWPSFGIAK